MSTLDEITKEKQRLGEALARVDAQREKLSSQLNELEATERVLARYCKATPTRRRAAANTPTTATKAAAPARPRGRRRATTAKSAAGKRTSPSLNDQVLALATGASNWQDTAGNCRRLQGGSPEPCRRCHRPAQTGWPHRRARRETLRHAVGGNGATRGGLTPGWDWTIFPSASEPKEGATPPAMDTTHADLGEAGDSERR